MTSSQRRGWSDQPQTGLRDKSFLRIPTAGVQGPHNLLSMPITVTTNTTQEEIWERKDWVCFRSAGRVHHDREGVVVSTGPAVTAGMGGHRSLSPLSGSRERWMWPLSLSSPFPLSLSLRPAYGKEPPTPTVSLPPCLLQLSLSGNILTVRPRTTSPGWF